MSPLRPVLVVTVPLCLLLACPSGAPEAEPVEPTQIAIVTEPPAIPQDFGSLAGHFVRDGAEVAALEGELERVALDLAERLAAHGTADPDRVREILGEQVNNRLSSWVAKDHEQALPADAERIRRQAIEWEAFRLESYVSSGVFPKTYFGFFDQAWDTAEHERTLRDTTVCTREVINAWQAERDLPLRVTDAEIAVTFIAEGGALLLTTQQRRMDELHPVMDVGLDDIASGLGDYQGLLDQLDQGCGTDLRGTVVYTKSEEPPAGATGRLVAPKGQWAWLVRDATFREGIVGTALMWIWEKEIAARKLTAEGRDPLHQRGLDEQFVVGSLVYNSGILHAENTTRSLLRFQTGQRVYDDSEKNAHRRPRLNLLPPSGLLGEMLADGHYRGQPTSWLAVYHVLQRYGAWEGLRRFSDTFDEAGMFHDGGEDG